MGHGHVVPNPDGSKARCGGPTLCSECATELSRLLDSCGVTIGKGSYSAGPLKLDTDKQVFFYEQEFYVLSNFSAFRLKWVFHDFDTSEHAYHWARFDVPQDEWSTSEIARARHRHQIAILISRSAHEAYRYAQQHKDVQRPDWDQVKVGVMRNILKAKVDQHEYVRRKLLETGDRELIENSWRDSFWGWGHDRKGLNMLGKLWMEIRRELREHGA